MPCPSSSYTGGEERNSRWRNYIRQVDILVDTYWTPNSLEELVHIVQRAEREGRRVHAVGAGYSFEDIAATPDWMVDLRNLGGLIPDLVGPGPGSRALTAEWRARHFGELPTDSEKLVHIQAGARLFDLCVDLTREGRVLPTMGGALGQTVAGAISTSTHGSDVHLPPLCDFVRAVHLVTTGGRELWIESASQPLTDDDTALREALRACSDLEIIRDDELLDSVVVGMGRFGIVYAAVLQVSAPLFRMAEFTQELSWREVAAALRATGPEVTERMPFTALELLLAAPPADLQIARRANDYHYLDLTFNSRNSSVCWVRRRWATRSESDLNLDASNVLCDRGVANAVLVAASGGLQAYSGLVAGIPVFGFGKSIEINVRATELSAMATDPNLTAGEALSAAVNAIWASHVDPFPISHLVDEITQLTIAASLRPSMTQGRRGLNWHVAAGRSDPASIGDCYRGNSIEIVFGLETRHEPHGYISFLEAVLAQAGGHRQAGYIAVRFTRASRALLSMHNFNHRVACSIEITSVKGMAGNAEWMRWVERTAVEMGGRPHWGQQNTLSRDQVERLYPADRLGRWRRQLQRVVGSSLTFSNDFTLRRGLEPAPSGPFGTVPLDLYWSDARGDNFTTATEVGRLDAVAAGYRFARTECFIFPAMQPGTIPVKLYWHGERGDNFLTTSAEGERDALDAGYQFVRIEGHVLRDRQLGTVPLDLYWSEERADNFYTATSAGRRDARAAGYRFVRTEGFVHPSSIALRAHAGTFVGAVGGGGGAVDAHRPWVREHETFEVAYLGGNRIALRTFVGLFMCAEGSGGREIVANRPAVGPWETFELVAAADNKVGLRVANGQFVCAEGGGGPLVANRSRVAEWESFELLGE